MKRDFIAPLICVNRIRFPCFQPHHQQQRRLAREREPHALAHAVGFKLAWVRNRVFRTTHLVAIGIVTTLSVLDVPWLPTVLEDYLRIGAAGPQGFVQRWVSAWLYYDFPG